MFFFVVGVYIVVVLGGNAHLIVVIWLFVVGIVVVLCGVFVGLTVLRLHGLYFVIVTFGFVYIG